MLTIDHGGQYTVVYADGLSEGSAYYRTAEKGIDAVQIGLLLLVSMGAFFLCQHLNGIFVQILSIFMGRTGGSGNE